MLVLVHISDAGVNESGCTVEGATARVTCWLARIGICKRFGALDVDVGLAPESMPKRGSLPVGYKIGPIDDAARCAPGDKHVAGEGRADTCLPGRAGIRR